MRQTKIRPFYPLFLLEQSTPPRQTRPQQAAQAQPPHQQVQQPWQTQGQAQPFQAQYYPQQTINQPAQPYRVDQPPAVYQQPNQIPAQMLEPARPQVVYLREPATARQPSLNQNVYVIPADQARYDRHPRGCRCNACSGRPSRYEDVEEVRMIRY